MPSVFLPSRRLQILAKTLDCKVRHFWISIHLPQAKSAFCTWSGTGIDVSRDHIITLHQRSDLTSLSTRLEELSTAVDSSGRLRLLLLLLPHQTLSINSSFNRINLDLHQPISHPPTLSHPSTTLSTMTRTHKTGDRDHVGLANGTAAPEEHLPRYFGKSGYAGNDPRDTKKQGSGKGNWGRQGEELEDYNYNMAKPRRRTNSMSATRTLKTKFEDLDPEAIDYEEDVHGPSAADYEALEKMSTSSSADTMGSVDEEEEHAVVEKK